MLVRQSLVLNDHGTEYVMHNMYYYISLLMIGDTQIWKNRYSVSAGIMILNNKW